MAKENKNKLNLGDIMSKVLLTPIVLKSIVITVLAYVFIYLIGLFNLAAFFVAFTAIFVALIVVQEFQAGSKGVEHDAAELGILALIIALIVDFAKIDLASFQLVPVLETLVVTFVAIILYLLILHPTKMEKEYAQHMGKKYMSR